MTPELIEDVTLINGPFSAEHGDFSGLGVVQVRLKEELPNVLTARVQGGSFNTKRVFLGWSPDVDWRDMFFAYEGSSSDGPFVKPLNHVRHNVTSNSTWILGRGERRFGLKWNGRLNQFQSSGQLPLDEVAAGRLDRFGYISPGDGGDVQQGRLGSYWRKDFDRGTVWKADAFIRRSLFDLYSNFTFFLNNPEVGDAIQQHDSRLSQGANASAQAADFRRRYGAAHLRGQRAREPKPGRTARRDRPRSLQRADRRARRRDQRVGLRAAAGRLGRRASN
ncbi:MAG: hypothetical protein R2724_23980 [Bryobacterales bacterium]